MFVVEGKQLKWFISPDRTSLILSNERNSNTVQVGHLILTNQIVYLLRSY